MRRVYLAARFGRAAEMRDRARDLETLGLKVSSRWIAPSNTSEGDPTVPLERQAACADIDLEDIRVSEGLILFTEETKSIGRSIEFGYALALSHLGVNIELHIVGPRESVFHCLPQVKHHATWEEFVRYLDEVRKD